MKEAESIAGSGGGGPLAGYRVLDLTEEMGALCGKILGDLGADVVKVEPPEGDPTRRLGPFKGDVPDPDGSLRFASLNTGKRGVTLNLHCPEGQAILGRLALSADVLVESDRSGDLDALGISPQALTKANPALIWASITGFGSTGPYRDFAASDMVLFAMGGLMNLSGDPAEPPVVAPETQAYYMGCLQAAFGIMVALTHRAATGRGQRVEVSVQDCLASQEHQISRYSQDSGVLRREGSQHSGVAPGTIYPCQDGYIHIFVTTTWDALLELMGGPEALSDPQWKENPYRRSHLEVLDPAVAQFTASYRKNELVEDAQERQIPCAPVNTIGEVARDPHLRERGFFLQADHPRLGTTDYTGLPYRFSEIPIDRLRPAPLLGQHNQEVYGGELGFSAAELAAMRAAGVI